MTENEALEEHKKDCRRCRDKACTHGCDCLQKKDIEVYEELKQYRAIGTVEEVKDAYGRGYNQGTIDRAEELQKCREYGYKQAVDEFSEELKFLRQWKSDIMNDFCKYDASSVDEIALHARNKAIDEFVKKLEEWNEKVKSIRNEDAFFTIENICKVADQLKGGK